MSWVLSVALASVLTSSPAAVPSEPAQRVADATPAEPELPGGCPTSWFCFKPPTGELFPVVADKRMAVYATLAATGLFGVLVLPVVPYVAQVLVTNVMLSETRVPADWEVWVPFWIWVLGPYLFLDVTMLLTVATLGVLWPVGAAGLAFAAVSALYIYPVTMLHVYNRKATRIRHEASTRLVGADIVTSVAPERVVRELKLEGCTVTTSGKPFTTPDLQYFIIRDGEGTALYEKESSATGAIFRNHWSADDGEHYFAWVHTNKMGWEFVIPADPAQEGKRLAYDATDADKDESGVVRPRGQPNVTCRLVPVGPTPASAPDATPAEPAAQP
ncbi:MAG: hypothetical protein AB2A00_03495 [Myxococcota bacterium]